MAHSHLKAITARAKKIYKAHPNMKWTSAIKEASRLLGKKKKVGATKKKKSAPRKKTIRKIKAYHAKEGAAIRSLGSVASHVSSAKKLIEHEIGRLEVQKFVAKKKSHKNKIAKRIAAKKSQFRKLC